MGRRGCGATSANRSCEVKTERHNTAKTLKFSAIKPYFANTDERKTEH